MIRIAVCMKQVPDPESPPASFSVDGEDLRVRLEGVPPVMSTFDESALELAVRLKESVEARVTLLSAGHSLSKAVVLKAAAVGADDVALVDDEGLDRERLDGFATAEVLAGAIRKLGGFDLVLAGRQASDTNAGQVGPLLAAELGLPVAGPVQKVDLRDGTLLVERMLSDGYEKVEIDLPCVVTISHEVGELRYPSLAAIKAAKSLPQEVFRLSDLDAAPGRGQAVDVVSLSVPSRERRCVMIEAEEPEEAGAKLAERLVADRVLPA